MLAKTILGLALLAGTTLAAPAPSPCARGKRGCVTPTPSPVTGDTIYPNSVANYDVGNGHLTHTGWGSVYKADSDGGHDRTTLLTFTYPAAAAGKTCQLFFPLEGWETATGSQQVDVYTSLQAAPGYDTFDWPPGNQRDQELGRLDVVVGGEATWDWTSSGFLTGPTPCGVAGGQVNLELVGVNDNDDVEWDPWVSGAQIRYW